MVDNKEIPPSIFDIKLNTLQGGVFNWDSCRGKKVLFVNTASECGFTKQYEDLQKLSDLYPDQLVVIGVPCNQFGKQEPGDAATITNFCSLNFGVSFPLTEKLEVKGSNQHPLYQWLTHKKYNGKSNSSVKCDFQKYLIDEEGKWLTYFSPKVKPMSEEVVSWLKQN